MILQIQERYQFGPFRLDPAEHTLLRGDQVVALTPKAFETLALLVRSSGHLVRKEELIERVWREFRTPSGSAPLLDRRAGGCVPPGRGGMARIGISPEFAKS